MFSVLWWCGGGVEYLHRDPASRSRQWKGKSQIWDGKIWSRVPRDSGPRKTTLLRASSIYSLVREGAPQKQDRHCQRVINIWSWAPNGARHKRFTNWLTVSRNVTLTLTVLWSDPRLYNKMPTIIDSSLASWKSACEEKTFYVTRRIYCAVVTARPL
jgi:hypothetical protein